SYGFKNWAMMKARLVESASDATAVPGSVKIPAPRGDVIAPATARVTHGFRYDAMRWVNHSDSFRAAQVRKFVFKQTLEGDEQIINAEIERVVSTLPSADREQFGGRLTELIELGASPARSEISGALSRYCTEDLVRERAVELTGWCAARFLRAAAMGGWDDKKKIATAAKQLTTIDAETMLNWDPWGWARSVKAALAVRHLVDTTALIDTWMQALHGESNPAGCVRDFDPWDMFDAVVAVDHPLATDMVTRYLPMVMQSQSPDGGWDKRSLPVFTALVKHGLLGPLSELPSRPSPWQITHSIPAPAGNLNTLTWDGSRLWVLDLDTDTAIAVSPEDGRELKRLTAPLEGPGKIIGVGWYKDSMVITAGGKEHHEGPARVYLVDPDKGTARKILGVDAPWGPCGSTQVGDNLWIAHGWLVVINPETGEDHGHHSDYGSWSHDLAAEGDTLWHTDEWAPFLFHSDLNGNLIDSFEQPFFTHLGEGMPVAGITYDGERLWALDKKNKRICVIERNSTSGEEQ
ncbi:hypothetical protein ACFLSJ_06895, partial [Verrucomicrobiota bacterium]